MYKHIFFLLLLTFNVLFQIGGTFALVSELLFYMHFNPLITSIRQ